MDRQELPMETLPPRSGRTRRVRPVPVRASRSPRKLAGRIVPAAVLAGLAIVGVSLSRRDKRTVASDAFADARFVADFAVTDLDGRPVTPDAWTSHPANLLVAIGDDSESARASLDRLDSTLGRSPSIGRFGVVVDPSLDPSEARSTAEAAGVGDGWRVLLDPTHEIVGQAGLRSIGDLAVVDRDGLVVYRGDAGEVADAVWYATRGRTARTSETPAPGPPLPEPAPLIPVGASTTYSGQVEPILRAHCVDCHRPGEVAPFSLLTYRDAAKRAPFLAEIAASRRMPPWKAQPGYGRFLDAHRLTRLELALLADWAETGAAEGTPAGPTPPAPPGDGWRLGPPDLVLTMAEPYAVPATGDDFRGFVLPARFAEDRAVAAIEFRPGNHKVVHHARVFIDETSYSRDLDAAHPGPGFFYGGGADIPRPSLGEWNPGVTPRPPIEGVAKPLRAGAEGVVLIHYHGTGKPETDRSSVGIYFAKGPTRRILAMHPLASDRLDIPAGEPRHREVARSTLPHDVHAYSVLPHGHNLLGEIRFTANLPDGSIRRLLWVKDWDLNWQGQYHFAEPIALPRGTKVEVVAFFVYSSDNPANPNRPPVRMTYGPGTDAEMLGCHLYVVADDDAGDAHYRKQWERGF